MVVALASWAALAAMPANAEVRLSSSPGLRPAFDPDVTNYVIRCVPGQPLELSASASNGDQVAIAGRAPRSGDFTEQVDRRTGAAFTVRVHSHGRITTDHVRCLPEDFPGWETARRGTPQAAWYVITPVGNHTTGYVAIFDSHGVPVWWRHGSTYSPWDAKLLPDGNLAWTRYLGDQFGKRPGTAYEEHRLDGHLVRVISAVGNPTDTHDMQALPNGNHLVIAYRARAGADLSPYGGPHDAVVYDGEIQEVTPGGKVAWYWNTRDHIPLSETGRWWDLLIKGQSKKPAERRTYDIIHLNTVEPDGDGLIVSARHLDAVYKIDRRTGAIEWKLGGTHRPESLSVRGDSLPGPTLGGQHDARLYDDGTLTVYDNNAYLGHPPHALRFRIDAKKRTAKLLEHIDQPEVPESNFVGSARKLPGGNWVVCWGGSPLVTEQTPAGRAVLSISFRDDRYSYRAIPILPGRLSGRSLRRGMDRMARGAPSR